MEASKEQEVLLRKRKNTYEKRIQIQERNKKRALEQKKKRESDKKPKFIRAETYVKRHRATEVEEKRVRLVSEHNREVLKNLDDDGESSLKFVMRIEGPPYARVPAKTAKVLEVLRLHKVNDGTFIKFNEKVKPLLRLANPYLVIGTPSLATVRELIQKRAKVSIEKESEDGDGEIEKLTVSVPLNDNNLIEERLGDEGIICVEDVIHEIATLGDSFKTCVKFMEPFELASPTSGWGPLQKLKRLELNEQNKKQHVNKSADAPLAEVDIDKFIAEQV